MSETRRPNPGPNLWSHDPPRLEIVRENTLPDGKTENQEANDTQAALLFGCAVVVTYLLLGLAVYFIFLE